MRGKRRVFAPEFKARVALEAGKGEATLSQLVSRFAIHANLISLWKKQLLAGLPDLFADATPSRVQSAEQEQQALFEQIGRLQMEIALLKKKSAQFS